MGGKVREAARFFTGLPGIVAWIAVVSKLVMPGMGTEWWTIPRRNRMPVPSPAVGLSAVADIIGKPKGVTMIKECLTKETNIDTVIVEKMLQFKLPAAHSAFQENRRRGLARSVLGLAAIFGHEENDVCLGQPEGRLPLRGGRRLM
jgi:hypothetical protein